MGDVRFDSDCRCQIFLQIYVNLINVLCNFNRSNYNMLVYVIIDRVLRSNHFIVMVGGLAFNEISIIKLKT